MPCILVSPWSAGGWVCSERFDHTSVLQFLERFTGVRETNITDWRRSTFGDLASAFRLGQAARKPPPLPDTAGPLALAKYGSSNLPAPVFPGEEQQLPKQETGERKHLTARES